MYGSHDQAAALQGSSSFTSIPSLKRTLLITLARCSNRGCAASSSRFHPEFVDQREHRVARDAALGPIRPMADGRKRRLDHVGRVDVDPVLGREIVEGQQRPPVLRQARGGFRVLGAVGLEELVEGAAAKRCGIWL